MLILMTIRRHILASAIRGHSISPTGVQSPTDRPRVILKLLGGFHDISLCTSHTPKTPLAASRGTQSVGAHPEDFRKRTSNLEPVS